MKIRQHIPNFLTTLNLVSGLVSLTLAFEGRFALAAMCIFIAALFDFMDGNAARILKVKSELGKQLDSLADMVSFGVAPGIIIYEMLSIHCTGGCSVPEKTHILPYLAMLIPVCSALRLAKFNIDLRQEVNFIGMPTPAIAIFFASVPLVVYVQPVMFSLIHLDFMGRLFSNPRILSILVVFFSYMLISDFRIFSLKFKSLAWKNNQLRFILLICAVILLLLFSLSAIPMIIMIYVMLSIFFQEYIGE